MEQARVQAPTLRSSALRLGTRVRSGVAAFYAGAVAAWGAAIWCVRPDPLALAALLPGAVHLGWQVATLRPDDGAGGGAGALARFRSNRFTGLLLFLGFLVVGAS